MSVVSLAWASGRVSFGFWVFLTVLSALTPIAGAAAFAWLVASLADSTQGEPLVAAGLLVVIALLSDTAQTYRMLSHAILRRRVELNLQLRVVAKLSQQDSLRDFEDPQFQSEVEFARAGGLGAPTGILDSLNELAGSMITLVGFAWAVFAISPLLLLPSAGYAAVGVWRHLYLGGREVGVAQVTTPHRIRKTFFMSVFLDPRSVRDVMTFGAGDFFARRMSDEITAINDAETDLDRERSRVRVGIALVGAIGQAASLGYVIWLVGRGQASIGSIVLTIAALAGMAASLESLMNQIGTLSVAIRFFGVFEDFEGTQSHGDRAGSVAAPLTNGRQAVLEVKDLGFAYLDSEGKGFSLANLSFAIPPNSSLAIVGPNGAGKTTLVKLLLGLYQPLQGAITWGGTPIDRFRREGQILPVGAIFQDFMKYDLTIRENITLGHRGSKDNRRLHEALNEVGLAAVVEAAPHGLETLLTTTHVDGMPTKGFDLSHGQWQRLAVARLLYRDAGLLVLDEPTAALDAENEAALMSTLLASRRSVVVVTHRMTTARLCDRILVIADGHAVESGSHSDLVQSDGLYASWCRLQGLSS